MTHSFLLETGSWMINGHWLERNKMPITVTGVTVISWNEENWFTMVTKLIFPDSDRSQISFQYRGHFHSDGNQYTYVLKQSVLGRIEGEGWLGPESIVQRYWVLSDQQKKGGFDSFYRLNQNTYNLSSGVFTGHYLSSSMEAIIKRQK